MNNNKILRDANLTPTPGRVAVLRVLLAGKVMSASDIARGINKRASVPVATVYRTLSSLCKAGIAQRIPTEHGALYTLARDDESPRLLCSRCGKIEKIDGIAMRRYVEGLKKQRRQSILMVADCKQERCNT